MRRSSLLLSGLLAVCVLTLPAGTATAGPAVRAVWIDCWGAGIYNASQCDRTIAWAHRAGLNTLLVEVRKTGDAYYHSTLEPRGIPAATSQSPSTGFDPLAYMIDHAKHRHGMRVEAWLVANRIWLGRRNPPRTTPEHIVNAHPEWLLISRHGHTRESRKKPDVFIDPSSPGAVAHTTAVAADIARRYAIDAIHLDYIRYPGKEWGYGPRSLARFRQDTGATGIPAPDDPTFTAWRAAQVTNLVRSIRQAVEEARPGTQLTVATVAWDKPHPEDFREARSYYDAMQDWPLWCELGLVDINYVMLYKRQHVPAQVRQYDNWLKFLNQTRTTSAACTVIGQGAYLNNIAGTIQQARTALAQGFDGYCIYSYRTTNRGQVNQAAMAEALRTLNAGAPTTLPPCPRGTALGTP